MHLKLLILAFMALIFSPFASAQTDQSIPAQKPLTSEESPIPEEPPTPEEHVWKICNETSFLLSVATANVPKGKSGAPLTVQGWHRLRPAQCKEINAEKRTPRFVYARSSKLHQGGIREWKGRHEYCIGDVDFTAKTDMSCALQKLSSAKFLRIIPSEQRTVFVEPSNFGSKAETAGLQRLLMDNGYNIKRVDGFDGKQTSKTLNKFLKDNDLSTTISTDEKYAALTKDAVKKVDKIGITLCNKTKEKIWSAIAYQGDEWIVAKGWWPLEAQQCIHPYTSSLKNKETYIYARKEQSEGALSAQDRILKASTKEGRNFCIGEAKFSSTRHKFCTDQGYISARFKKLENDKVGAKINFNDADFTTGVISSLRD
ncbi:MAG: DUF1036 domain-containing protein [Robiginitomaculum sp.]